MREREGEVHVYMCTCVGRVPYVSNSIYIMHDTKQQLSPINFGVQYNILGRKSRTHKGVEML